MKLKQLILVIMFFSVILIFSPTIVFAIMPSYRYNIINMLISNVLIITAPIVSIIFVIWSIRYAIKSKENRKKKTKKIIKLLLRISIIVILLSVAAVGVAKLGTTYGDSPMSTTITQYNEKSLFISQVMRVIALVVIISDIIFSIIYFIKSKKEVEQKINFITKCMIIIAIVTGILLYEAPRVEEIGANYIEVNFNDFLK